MNYTYRYATPDDDERLLELFAASFNRSFTLDYWRWFSRDCPAGPSRTVISEAEDGVFAGSYTLWPQRLWLNGEVVKASAAVMVNTHPDHQGQGVFVAEGEWATAHECLHDTPLSIAMPNTKAWPGHRKVGYEEAFPLVFRVRYKPKARPHGCVQVERFGPGLDAMLERLRFEYAFLPLKNSRWLNWRTVERPEREYSLWVYPEDGEVEGYCVLKHFDEPRSSGIYEAHSQGMYYKSHIVDINALTPHVYHELLACAETFAAGRDELNLWSNRNDLWRAVLGSAGYVARETTDKVIMRTNYGPRLWPEAGAWGYALADNDVY